MARATTEAGGAVAGMGIQLMRAVADDNPNTLKRFEKAMPSAARNMSRAYRYATEGEETLASGAALAEFDLEDSKHVAEIMFQAAGFPPTRVQEEKEKYYATREVVMYYELRRRRLMELLDHSRRIDDSKYEKEVRERIIKYNKTVPYPAMRLGPKDIRRSLKQRAKDRILIEKGRYTPKRGRQIQEDIDEAFPEEPVP